MSEAERDLLIVRRAIEAGEREWVEFKESNADPAMIGRRVSALANAAALAGRDCAYLAWGVRDDGLVVGTSFEPQAERHGTQPLPLWLAQRLDPAPTLRFASVAHPDGRVVLLEVPAATTAPVSFDRAAYVRIGEATPRLSDHRDIEARLWTALRQTAWEYGAAKAFVTSDEVVRLIDYPAYFELTGQPLPSTRDGIIERLVADELVSRDASGRWNVTNLGAILFARRLSDYSADLARKAPRIVAFSGKGRTDPVTKRLDGVGGYAASFDGLTAFIEGLLPANEHIGRTFRTEEKVFPILAVRELIANALVHQDMTARGQGPLIELFEDRLEITNPGEPLVPTARLLDYPPRSRNQALASLMRRIGLCEEGGTGIDKVLTQAELFQLPPPDFRAEGDATRVTLFAPRGFADMTPDERVRACYQHAALRFVEGTKMRNASLRDRLGIEQRNSSQVTRVINDALDKGLIKVADPDHPRAGYIPFWA